MDDMVLKAMAKWPNVPDCFGWLGYDRRGDWYMRDAAVQTHGSFQFACRDGDMTGKGAKLQHSKLIAFIERNYAVDPVGRWYFQNGPQRVYVELELAPYVVRLEASGEVRMHTGVCFIPDKTFFDEHGHLFARTPDCAIALVHSQDVLSAADLIDAGKWPDPIEIPADNEIWSSFVRSPENTEKYKDKKAD